MAIIIEDGTGVKGANSYVSVSFFNDYFDARGNNPSLADSVVQQLCVKATQYIDTTWGRKFKGFKQFSKNLTSRSILSFTDQPANAESFTLDNTEYFFVTEVTGTNEILIGLSLWDTIANTVSVVSSSSNSSVESITGDFEENKVIVYFTRDGVSSTETIANGSFDSAVSYGRTSLPQPLEFPRRALYYPDGSSVIGIPPNLKAATCEYALEANTTNLNPSIAFNDSGQRLTMAREKTGPLESEKRFAETGDILTIRPIPIADSLLKPFVSSGGVIRA